MGKKCQNANICFTSVCEVLYKGEMNKPTKLRLIADLIENPRPFEVKTEHGTWVTPLEALPDSFLEDRWEIRIKPESATFEAHGKTWTRHKPGDPMPCDGEAIVDILSRDNTLGSTLKAKNRWWDTGLTISAQIIGWRYADKPAWKLPDPPAGKQWHTSKGWTEEMLPEGWRPLLLGEKLQTQTDEISPKVPTNWEAIYGLAGDSVNELSDYWFFRTRRPLPAEPVMVPLEAADVPPGSVLRWCGEYWQAIVGTEPNGVYHAHNDNIELVTWEELTSHEWQIKRPGQDWQPCSKPSAQ